MSTKPKEKKRRTSNPWKGITSSWHMPGTWMFGEKEAPQKGPIEAGKVVPFLP